jgi:hypothetical protein
MGGASMTIRTVYCLAFAFLLTAWPLAAQVDTATIRGTVRDPSGAVVPAAQVTVQSKGQGWKRVVTTNDVGEFVITELPVGYYQLTVTHRGFKTATVRNIELQVAQTDQVNPVLQIGGAAQVVTVTAAPPLLNTANASVGQVIDTHAVEAMPLDGRNFWQLTELVPGASYIPGGRNIQGNGKSIRATLVNVNVNGQSPTWVGWSLDGTNITEFQLGGTLIQPNVDALQEFKVETGNMSAQYGHTPTMITAELKSGTNQIHGDVYEFLRNNAFDAADFFFRPPPGSTARNEALHRNQYGGTLGGPIRRDRAFFFGDYEETRLSQAEDFNNVVPSAAEREGNFSELLAGSKPKKIVNPLTGTPFPDNIIPASMISSQAKFLLPFMPMPNLVEGTTSRSVLTSPLTQTLRRGDLRIDDEITARDHLTASYSISDNDESDPNPFPAIGHFALHSRAQSVALSLTHIFSPRWLNDLRFGYYRSYFLFGGALQGTNIDQEAGIHGFSSLSTITGFPQIAISGYSTYTGSPSDERPKQNRIRDWQYSDNLSYVKGKNHLEVGLSWYHNTNTFITGLDSVGKFAFKGTYSGNGFADFLLGYPDNVERSTFRNLFGDWGNFQGYYFQDDYQALPDLTLNLGVRYEINPFYTGVRGQNTALNFQNGDLILPANFDLNAQVGEPLLYSLFSDRIQFNNQLGLPVSLRPTGYNNWAPRIGFAWRPFGSNNWVVRSGYGIFYAFPDDNLINNTAETVPFTALQTVFNDRPPAAPTLTFGNFFQGEPIAAPNPNPGQPCSFGFVANSCSTPDITAGPPHVGATYVQEWNFSVQREITPYVSLNLAYVGNKTTHLQQFMQRNDPPPGPGSIQPRRPYAQWGAIRSVEWGGTANYNALQMTLQTHTWHRLSSLVSYSWSRCLDNGTSESGVTTLLIPESYGVCNFDLPQSLVVSDSYQLPVGQGQALLHSLPGWANQALGGWQIAGITTLHSGLPFTPTISKDVANTGVGSQRPNLIGTPIVPATPSCWFFTSDNSSCTALLPNAPDAFLIPTKYTYGDAGRNILRADGLVEFDFTLMKDFKLTESKTLELRSEFFNLFNTPTFGTPSENVDTSSGGQVGSTLNGPRIIQVALKLVF